MPHSLETLGLKIPHIYLPENTRALDTWCVIACDQYTSDPAYWENVERTVGEMCIRDSSMPIPRAPWMKCCRSVHKC